MSRHPPPRRLLEFAAVPAIDLSRNAGAGRGRTRWALMLVWFCRLCAVMWLTAGLLHWAFMLDIIPIPGVSFETSTLPAKLAEVFFANVDLIAAVGLWLMAPWGGPVWLLAAGAQIALPFILHNYGGGSLLVIATNTVLIAIYAAIFYVNRRINRE